MTVFHKVTRVISEKALREKQRIYCIWDESLQQKMLSFIVENLLCPLHAETFEGKILKHFRGAHVRRFSKTEVLVPKI